MAIVIGAATQVSFGNACAISANWSYSPNVQRLYCIGEWTPSVDRTFYRPTESLNITIYAPGPTYRTEPTQSCVDANTIPAGVSPATCGGDFVDSFSGDWMVASYSYSKDDATLPGQESWSMTRWQNLDTSSPQNSIDPTYVMRGIAEGQATDDAGVSFLGITVDTFTGNVSAGGFGRADTLEMGVVDQVGGGSSVAGITGQGSASMPYTPLYI